MNLSTKQFNQLILLILLVVIIFFLNADVFAEDTKYLGNLNSNPYDENSINNPYSDIANPYSDDSLTNPYSTYNDPYSDSSINNPYATDAPKIYSDN